MKPITSFALLSALASLAAQGAVTGPVGYETNDYAVGFNLVGIRLHEPAVISGDLETINVASVEDTDVADFAAVLGASGTSGTYVLEVSDGSGIYQLPTTWTGSSIDVAADLTGDVAPGATYTIRPASTLASVFGAANGVANAGAGLGAGSGGPASSATIDQVWVPDGAGGYDRYYYDNFAPPTYTGASWALVDSGAPGGAVAVDATSIVLPYPQGFLINAATAGSLVVTGDVKVDVTETDFNPGFNVVSSVAPAGATLVTAFGAANEAGLNPGSGGPASSATIDQVWISDGVGGYDRYYYDNFAPPTYTGASWALIDSGAPGGAVAVDGSTISLPSGYLINSPAGGMVVQGIPAWPSL